MTNQPNQNNSLRFQDSTSQAHYYEADEYVGEYPANLEDAYFADVVMQDLISHLKQPVTICFSFCERDMNRNEIPF
jgi:hypothetical protein